MHILPYEKKSLAMEKEVDIAFFDSLSEEENAIDSKIESTKNYIIKLHRGLIIIEK